MQRRSGIRITLAGLLALGLLMSGAVEGPQKAVLWLGTALACAVFARRSHGSGDPLAVPVATLACVQLAGLLPLPHALAVWIAPSAARAWPEASWVSPAIDRGAVLEAVACTLGVGAFASLARAGGSARRYRAMAAWGAVALSVLGAVHACVGADALFGVFRVRTHTGLYLPPLVNPNHTGTLLLLSWPFAAIFARDAWQRRDWTRVVVFGFALGYTAIFPLLARSAGVGLALLVQGGLLARESAWGRPRRWATVLIGFGSATVGLGALWVLQPRWTLLSVLPRVEQWRDSTRMWLDNPVFGVGAGNYAVAYPPYRTLSIFAQFDHAHADVLEWVVETGLVGLVGLGFVIGRVRNVFKPGLAYKLALMGLFVHAWLDFPLHIPAVLMLASVVLVHATDVRAPSPSALRRWALVALFAGLVQGMCAGVSWVEDEVAQGRMEASKAFAWMGWDRELAWRAAGPHAPVDVLADLAGQVSEDPLAQLTIASWLAARGESPERIDALIGRALARDPHDVRAWVALARLHGQRRERGQALEAWHEAFVRWHALAEQSVPLMKEAYADMPLADLWVDKLADAPAIWSYTLAGLLLEQHEPEAALRAALQAEHLLPRVYHHNAAALRALLALGRFDEAKRGAEAWLSEDAHNPLPHQVRLQALLAEGALDGVARGVLDAMSSSDPGAFVELGERWRARCAAEGGCEDRASRVLRAILEAPACGLDAAACVRVRTQILDLPGWQEAWRKALPSCARACVQEGVADPG